MLNNKEEQKMIIAPKNPIIKIIIWIFKHL